MPVVKSGTDFQHLTEVRIELLPAGAGAANGRDSRTPPASPSAASGWGGAAPTSPGARPAEVPALAGTLLRCSSLPDGGCSSPEGASAAEVYAGAADASLAAAMETCRAAGGEPGSGTLVRASCRRHPITAEVAPDPAVEEIVQARPGASLTAALGATPPWLALVLCPPLLHGSLGPCCRALRPAHCPSANL